jgi:anaerobic ribonucleoside-triphosphate reductase activating protein
VIFAQGCPHRCEGCHNPQTHDFDGGEITDTETIAREIKKDPLLGGATFSGGEPFAQPEAFIDLAKRLEGMNIICYTGYTFEELYSPEKTAETELLSLIDILIDGRFDQNRKSLELKFKGSANQRVINSKESVKRGKAIETVL